jgi:hypothetical protein
VVLKCRAALANLLLLQAEVDVDVLVLRHRARASRLAQMLLRGGSAELLPLARGTWERFAWGRNSESDGADDDDEFTSAIHVSCLKEERPTYKPIATDHRESPALAVCVPCPVLL